MLKFVLILLTACSLLSAAGTVSYTASQVGVPGDAWVIAFNWVADASDGSVPVTAAVMLPAQMQGFYPFTVETSPLTPSPTAGYSVAVLDASGADILAGAAASSSATVGQSWAASAAAPPLNGVLRLKL